MEKQLSAETDVAKTEYQRFGMAVYSFAQSVPNIECILKRMLKFRCQKVDMLHFDGLFDRVTEGTDFINYEILNVITEACNSVCIGSTNTELQMKKDNAEAASEKYQEVFLKFAQHRVFSICGQLQEMSSASKGSAKELKIKVEEDSRTFSLERIFHFKIAVKRILQFPEHVYLRVVLVKEGCVELTFQLIGTAQDVPLQLSLDQKRELASHRVSLLEYAGKVEYCCCELFEDEVLTVK